MTRHALIALVALALLAAGMRACAHRAGGEPSVVDPAPAYLPIADQGAPRCNRWRGDDWLLCLLATLTTEARVSSTPTATLRPWTSSTPLPWPTLGPRASGTPTPMELEQPAETTPRPARPYLRRLPLVTVWRAADGRGPPYRWEDTLDWRASTKPAPISTATATRTRVPSATRPQRATGTPRPAPTRGPGQAAPWPTCGLCTSAPGASATWPLCSPFAPACTHTLTPRPTATDTPHPTATHEPTPTRAVQAWPAPSPVLLGTATPAWVGRYPLILIWRNRRRP